MDKLFKRTIMVLLALLPCISLSTVNALTDDPPLGKPINVNELPPLPPRSIAPECYYLDGYVYIIGDNSITSITGTVTRLSDNVQWNGNCTSNNLQIVVSTDPGAYSLTFTISDGSTYQGIYYLD